MGQVLHGCATTTEAVRRAIQHSQESLRALARRYGINQKTVAKWKKRSATADLPTGPKDPKSTSLSLEDEAVIVAFRQHTLLPLDDCLYALQATIPHLTRSSLHRCLQRHGISRLPDIEDGKGIKRDRHHAPMTDVGHVGYFAQPLVDLPRRQACAAGQKGQCAFTADWQRQAERPKSADEPPPRQRHRRVTTKPTRLHGSTSIAAAMHELHVTDGRPYRCQDGVPTDTIFRRAHTETSMTSITPDLNSPEFAPIKSQLARAFIEHKADLGPAAAAASDQAVVDQVMTSARCWCAAWRLR